MSEGGFAPPSFSWSRAKIRRAVKRVLPAAGKSRSQTTRMALATMPTVCGQAIKMLSASGSGAPSTRPKSRDSGSSMASG
jgi:hypothetical protein